MVNIKCLYVEGPDDRHVMYSLMARYDLAGVCTVEPKEGITNLLEALRVQLKARDEDIPLERLGIIVDADTNLAARWTAIRNILIRSGYTDVPPTPDPMGTIIQQIGRPKIGVWLMPSNDRNGILEDFIRLLVPPGDTLWPQAEACLSHIAQHERRFSPEQYSKALIHTWLAWQTEPGRPLGQSITARYLDPDAPHAQVLIAWFRRLFV